MKTAYVRFISHELRTPLNSVFMGMQLSIDQIPEDTQEPVELERRETLVETQSACGAALDILNELLLFDKLETGALVLNKLTVPVPELVEDSIKMFSVQTREKSLELVITNNDESMLASSAEDQSKADDTGTLDSCCSVGLTPSLYNTDEVYVDKNKVVQVIRNVVSNAIKFTPAFGKIQVNVRFLPSPSVVKKRSGKGSRSLSKSTKGATPIIEIDDQAAAPLLTPALEVRSPMPGELIIEIKDNGAGISEANQKKLFNEVVQFNPELLQNGGGSGLGMCISKGIVDMHGGSISVYSTGEGLGSVFTLRLPMTRLLSESSVLTLYQPAAATSSKSFKSRSSLHSSVTPTPRFQAAVPQTFDTTPTDSSKTAIPSESPLYPDPPDSTTKSPCSMSFKSTCGSIPERPLRFLVVDDSSLNRKMLCRLLRNQGHSCAEAEDGVQAVTMMTAALLVQPEVAGESKTAGNDLDEAIQSFKHAPGADLENVYDAILMDFM